jgi:hypothetical protein
LVIARSEHCKFCKASRGFHHSVVVEAKSKGLPVLVLVPSGEDARTNLADLDVTDGDATVLKESMGSAGISAVPALLLVEHGKIVRAWIGLLPESEEANVRAQIESIKAGGPKSLPSGPSAPESTVLPPAERHINVRVGDLAAMRREEIILVDLRPRDEFRVRLSDYQSVTRNIPKDEIFGRYFELAQEGKRVVLDCAPVPSVTCERARDRLVIAGLHDVMLLDEGTYVAEACTSFK